MLTKTDLNAFEDILDRKLDEKLVPIQKDIRTIKRDLKRTINFFDKAHLGHEKRIKRIEGHLNFPAN